MTAATTQRFAGAYPIWTAEEDARLLKKLDGRVGLGQDFWIKFADRFPQRSFYALRQRYLTLRMRQAGRKPNRHPKPRGKKNQMRRSKEPAALRPIAPPYADLTAMLCGDPLPGRRALDQKRSAP